MVHDVVGCVGEIVSTTEVESKGRVGISIPSKNVLDAFPISCLVLCADTNEAVHSDNLAPPRLRIPSDGLNDWLNSYEPTPQTVDISFDDSLDKTYQQRQVQKHNFFSDNAGLPPKSISPRLRSGLSTYLWLRSKPTNNAAQEGSSIRENDPVQWNPASTVERSATKVRRFVQDFEAPVPPTPPPTKSRNRGGETAKFSKEPLPLKPSSTAPSDASSSHHFDDTLFSTPNPISTEFQRTAATKITGKPHNTRPRPKSAKARVGSSSPRLKSFGKRLPFDPYSEDFNTVSNLGDSTLKALEKHGIVPTAATKKELLILEREYSRREKLILQDLKL